MTNDAAFTTTNGPAAHGSIAAFKVEEKDGHVTLTPVWRSRDLTSPAPPVVANGVVFGLDAGKTSPHATLYALDAASGKILWRTLLNSPTTTRCTPSAYRSSTSRLLKSRPWLGLCTSGANAQTVSVISGTMKVVQWYEPREFFAACAQAR